MESLGFWRDLLGGKTFEEALGVNAMMPPVVVAYGLGPMFCGAANGHSETREPQAERRPEAVAKPVRE